MKLILKEYGGLAAFVLCLALMGAAFLLTSCAGPRSAQFCAQNGVWVKCPKGIKPGTDLDLRTRNERK